jgi:hypothetical protein
MSIPPTCYTCHSSSTIGIKSAFPLKAVMRDLTSTENRILIGLVAVPLSMFLNLDISYSPEGLNIKTKSSADLATALTAVVGIGTAGSALLKNSTKDEDK